MGLLLAVFYVILILGMALADPTAAPSYDVARVTTGEALKPLPENFFAYRGSLTTPPCSEGVRWFVIVEPDQLSATQLEAFTSVIHDNARPLQPRNERELTLATVEDQ